MKAQDGHSGTSYKGPVDCSKQILKTHGIKGLFRGWWATVFREAPAFGIYFFSYDYIKTLLRGGDGKVSHGSMLFAGGKKKCRFKTMNIA